MASLLLRRQVSRRRPVLVPCASSFLHVPYNHDNDEPATRSPQQPQKRFSSLLATRQPSNQPMTAALPQYINIVNNPNKSNNRLTLPPSLMMQQRSISWLPEVMQNFSIWGGSGWMLKVLHADGLVPYWACFSGINVLVRLCLLPVVVYGAHTAARFASVLPEVQFLVTIFQNDMRAFQKRGASTMERLKLMHLNLKSLGLIYKGYQVNPISVFLSPLLQLPIFYYVSVDLRKIVNGLDPNLAQNLVESSVLWVPDLTEPDPWFGLPILCGVLLYTNVEVSMGRRTLVGSAGSKANTAILLKDIFQSFAILMPCFTASLPAGLQIYLATTFGFTMVQSELLRTPVFRSMVGLPPLSLPTQDGEEPPKIEAPKYAKIFIRLRQLEYDAIRERGDGPLLGVGVLKSDYRGSFAGTNRPTTIKGSGSVVASRALSTPPSKKIVTDADKNNSNSSSSQPNDAMSSDRSTLAMENLPFGKEPFIHGISAPLWQQQEQAPQFMTPEQAAAVTGKLEEIRSENTPKRKELSPQELQEELIAKANRGEKPVPTRFGSIKKRSSPSSPTQVNLKRFKKKAAPASGGKRKKKRR